MADDSSRPIIVKRITRHAPPHHGGAWKIAYADFVTAMMSFFLLMWLLGSTGRSDLEGVAEYFKTPLLVAMQGGKTSGSNTVILKGGGKDLTKKKGEEKKNVKPEIKKPEIKKPDLRTAQETLEKSEMEKLKALKEKIRAAIDSSPTMKQFKNQLLLDITTEGLRIQIVDEQNRPMFASAKAELQPYAKQILREIGQILNGLPNKISLSGHTDAVAYSKGEKSYSNWELSADRANASRRELVLGGMDETKLLRVVGLSSAVLFDKTNPLNPINRRISIIVMKKKAEEDAMNNDPALQVPNTESASNLNSELKPK